MTSDERERGGQASKGDGRPRAGSAGERTWRVGDVLQWTTGHFESLAMPTPRLDAEVLLCRVLGCDRLALYLDHDRPLNEPERAAYRDFVRRRASGEPAAYLLGEKEFYGRPFKIDRRVLVPRPETEHLVDAALEALGGSDEPVLLLDLCTGSGCIGVTLAAELPLAHVVATDLSPDAAAVARENAARLGVAERFEVLVGDLFEPVRSRGLGPFAAIVSNPPYIAAAEMNGLMRDVREHEPRAALEGGARGTELLERILREAPDFTLPGAAVILEHGEGQGAGLMSLVEADDRYERAARDLRDHAGLDRVLVVTTKAASG